MVVDRSDVKRRRKDAQGLLEGSPKRTKVHAQRKFAQGSGVNSPAMTPVKEKLKLNGVASPAELLPSKRPNTEDFLTFLCFRGTKALPPRLNFFNVAYKPEKEGKDSPNPGPSKSSPSAANEAQQESPKPRRTPQSRAKLNQPSAVQALKKKYREQRLAKNKANITELLKKVKGKNMVRTRSTVLLEERSKKQKTQEESPVKQQTPPKVKASNTVLLKRLGVNKSRAGLRSSGKLPPGSDVGIKSDRKPRKLVASKLLPKSAQQANKKASKLLKKALSVEKRPSSVEKRSSSLEKRPSSVEKRASSLEKKSTIEKRSSSLEKKPSSGEKKTSPEKRPHVEKKPLTEKKPPPEKRSSSLEKKSSSAEKRPSSLEKKPSSVEKRPSSLEKKSTSTEKKALAVDKGADSDDSRRAGRPISTRSQSHRGTTRQITPPNSLPNVKARPSRKTKEAATIYMEMLTKDLRSPDEDFDDDAISVESFSPVPSRKSSIVPEPTKESGQSEKQVKKGSKSTVKEKKGLDKKEEKKGLEKDLEKKSDKNDEKKLDKVELDKKPGKKSLEKPAEKKVAEKEQSPKGRKGKPDKIIDNLKNTTPKPPPVKDEKLVEKRSTRQGNFRPKEDSPVHRVLRAKRNRVSLAEDRFSSETDEDYYFEILNKIVSKKPPSQTVTKPTRKSGKKVEVESDVESEPEVKPKKKPVGRRPKVVEKKAVKKVENPSESEEEYVSNKKDETEEKTKKTKKGVKKEDEDSLEDKDSVESTKPLASRLRRGEPKVMKEETGSDSDDFDTPVAKVEIKTKYGRRSIRKVMIPSIEDSDSELEYKSNKEAKEDAKPRVSRNVAKKQAYRAVKRKHIKPDSESDTESEEDDEPVLKRVANFLNETKDVPLKKTSKTSTDNETNLRKKAEAITSCKVVLEPHESKTTQSNLEVKSQEIQNNNNEQELSKDETRVEKEAPETVESVSPPLEINKSTEQIKMKEKEESTRNLNAFKVTIDTCPTPPEIKEKFKKQVEVATKKGSPTQVEISASKAEAEKEMSLTKLSPKESVAVPKKTPGEGKHFLIIKDKVSRENELAKKPKMEIDLGKFCNKVNISSIVQEHISKAKSESAKWESKREALDTPVTSRKNETNNPKTPSQSPSFKGESSSKIEERGTKPFERKINLGDYFEKVGGKEKAFEALQVDTGMSADKPVSIEKKSDVPAVTLGQIGGIGPSGKLGSIQPPDSPSQSNQSKSKPSMCDTWRQAFKNAKIPKPGQLSPISHSVKPFVRKPFTNQAFMAQNKTRPEASKAKLGEAGSSKELLTVPKPSHFSPTGFPIRRFYPKEGGDSPSKKFGEDQEAEKKSEKPVVKSLTQLQYEKRTSELVSGLKDPYTPLIDANFLSMIPKQANQARSTDGPNTKQSFDKQAETQASKPAETSPFVKQTSEGKHMNLPLAVEHTLRKQSPTIVSKKPPPPVRYQAPQETKEVSTPVPAKVEDNPTSACTPLETAHKCVETKHSSNELVVNKAGDVDLMMKKKVNMTNEEIKRWLNDSTSSGIEHAKDCGIFERNQCECSFRTSSMSMEGSLGVSHLVPTDDPKIGKSVVEPPVQLKELDSDPKFCTETISTCKVEEYKEKILSKSSKSEVTSDKSGDSKIDQSSPSPSAPKKLKLEKPSQEKISKTSRSMTEDEMCEFDFRFERNLGSPRESGSEMSSPTMRDDVSSSNDETVEKPHSEHRKSIFHQKRLSTGGTIMKRPALSKSPCAFSPENESSVYAFEPDLPIAANKPFRRSASRGKSSDSPASSSIAVQVNLETEAVLECSTQTERETEEEGHLFYIPLQQGPGDAGAQPPQLIQGVAVKLDTEGPDQRVIMRAKLVTKPASIYSAPSTSRPLANGNGNGRTPSQKPEQKVRPLSSGASLSKPPVGTVQPTVREPKRTDQSTGTNDERPTQNTQATQFSSIKMTKEEPASLPEPTSSLPPPPVPPPPKPSKRQSIESISKAKPQPSLVPCKEFPDQGGQACLVEAPTFHPTEKEFLDPLDYIDKITPQAQHYGICRIVPPSNFKPECKVSDDMRFTAYNQYIHKLLHRWGPNVKEMSAIRKYLATQSFAFTQPPLLGGVELDLPRLYQTVQQCGGLKQVIEKKRWTKVADLMKVPKSAQDRVTKLDDIYCKFLLPYDTLSPDERNKLLDEVEQEWRERERKAAEENGAEVSDTDSDDRDECITKGRGMPLSSFYRIARNTLAMWFKDTPNPAEVETEFWKHVSTRQAHVCVHAGSIDSGTWGYGFPIAKSSSTSRHPWNLKVLTNNSGSVLRSMGPLMGVTVPTLHVGMLFSACCWYRDPHALPWIEYLHTGASKIWYGVPDDWSEELHGALKSLFPRYVRDKPIWLASDTAMVPPALLVERGVSLCRTVQEPGQFVLVFPKAFTSSVCTGYLVSESVYFAQPSWLNTAEQVFKETQESCEPTMFSLEKLIFCIATDVRSSIDVLNQVLPMVVALREFEVRKRRELESLGVVGTERLAVTKGRKARANDDQEEYECESCRASLFLSLVTNTHEEVNYCLTHAIEVLKKDPSQLKFCKLLYGYDEEEMEELITKVKVRIETKTQKKMQNKHNSGGSSRS